MQVSSSRFVVVHMHSAKAALRIKSAKVLSFPPPSPPAEIQSRVKYNGPPRPSSIPPPTVHHTLKRGESFTTLRSSKSRLPRLKNCVMLLNSGKSVLLLCDRFLYGMNGPALFHSLLSVCIEHAQIYTLSKTVPQC